MPRVTSLHIFPVKGCRGIDVTSAVVETEGLRRDRRFMVVDPGGKFLTQRSHPGLAQIRTAFDEHALVLSAEGAGELLVPAEAGREAQSTLVVSVWSSEGLIAEDCGDEAANWLGARLGCAVRLVRMGKDFQRPVKPSKARPGDAVSFADGYPLLLCSVASLNDLNDRIQERGGEPVPMGRFRANLVVEGAEAFAEDHWARIRIGEAVFRNAGPCARCIVTTTDQKSGKREGPEPLATLATFRRGGNGNDVNFGANLIPETVGARIRVGDAVEVL
jgi:uncharacterized protein